MKRKQIEDIITFTNILIKIYYNKFHIILKLIYNNIIYLRLHHKYKILNLNNRKLYHQKIDSFQIFEKMRFLAYRLKLPLIIKIHFVISIIQLKFASNNDLYERLYNMDFSLIKEKKNVDLDFIFKHKLYEIERFLK